MAQRNSTDVARPGVARDPGVSARPSTQVLTPSIDTSGAALQQFSNDLGAISRTFSALYEQRQDSEDRSFLDTYQLEFHKRSSEAEANAINSPDAGKKDFVELFDKQLNDIQDKVFDDLTKDGKFNPSKKGRDAAVAAAMQLRTAAARRTAVAVHNQRVSSLVDSTTQNVSEISSTSGINGDLLGGLGRVESSVQSLSKVLPPDKLRAYHKAAREQVFESVVRGYIERGQFGQARSLLDRNRGFASNSVEQNVAKAATDNGIDPAYLVAAAKLESSLNPFAKAKGTSASGLFQFVSATGETYGLPKDAAAATVDQQAAAAAKFTKDNAAALRKAIGRDPTNGELYLAHVLGAGDAIKVLEAEPDAPVQSIINSKSYSKNQVFHGKSASQLADWAHGRILSAGGGGSGDYVKEATRVQLLSLVETQQTAAEARAEKRMDKALTELGEQYLSEAYKRADAGALNVDYVEAIRPFIKPESYKGLLSALRGENNVDDSATIMQLTAAVDVDSEDTFLKKANDALTSNKIKTSTYTALVQKNRTAFKDDRPASPYKSGRELIKTSLDVGGIVDSSAAQIASIAQGQALIEYDNWIEANPEAKREDVIRESQNIISRYELVQVSKMKGAIGKSRFFGGKSNSEISIDDITAAEKALREEIRANKLTPSQQEFEIRRLQNWRSILTREAARPANPRGGR